MAPLVCHIQRGGIALPMSTHAQNFISQRYRRRYTQDCDDCHGHWVTSLHTNPPNSLGNGLTFAAAQRLLGSSHFTRARRPDPSGFIVNNLTPSMSSGSSTAILDPSGDHSAYAPGTASIIVVRDPLAPTNTKGLLWIRISEPLGDHESHLPLTSLRNMLRCGDGIVTIEGTGAMVVRLEPSCMRKSVYACAIACNDVYAPVGIKHNVLIGRPDRMHRVLSLHACQIPLIAFR